MGNPWENFSLVGMSLRSINPVGLYPLPSLIVVQLYIGFIVFLFLLGLARLRSRICMVSDWRRSEFLPSLLCRGGILLCHGRWRQQDISSHQLLGHRRRRDLFSPLVFTCRRPMVVQCLRCVSAVVPGAGSCGINKVWRLV
jgi:hypothetical protein